jgi:signal transduction histidine kinase
LISVIAAQRLGVLLAPSTPVRVVLAWSSEVALVCFPVGLLTGLVRSRLDRSAVADLAVALTGSPGPEPLRSALASAVHDPSLQVGYWLPEQRQYVDGSGVPVVTPAELSGRTMTALERDGRPVAALFHDTVLAEQRSLIQAVAAAAGLAIENERLHAEVRAQLTEVRASRARIVEASLTERRRVERDLHDGAQQRLLGVLLGLRLVRSQLDSGEYNAAGITVDEARRELSTGLDEIRELARGIHPAVLTDAGLPAALRSLAERAAVPVTITAVPSQRLPSVVEQTAYYVVAESVVNTVKHAHATSASVSIRLNAGQLRVEISDDGVGGAQPSHGSGLRGLSDRVAAVDGHLSVSSPPGSGTTVVGELPCV